MSWWRGLLDRLRGLPSVQYDMTHPKRAEAQMIQDLLAGRVRVRKTAHSRSTHREERWAATNSELVCEVDHPTIAHGTFSYLYVNGRDWIDSDPSVFDGWRVAAVMRTGADPGPQENHSLYWR